MELRVIGTFEDVTGFALAGAPGEVCADEATVAAALRAACTDSEVALVLLSAATAALAPALVARWQGRAGAPVILVLPAAEGASSRQVQR